MGRTPFLYRAAIFPGKNYAKVAIHSTFEGDCSRVALQNDRKKWRRNGEDVAVLLARRTFTQIVGEKSKKTVASL